MDTRQEYTLRINQVRIVDDLDPKDVLDTLVDDGVLTENDYERINTGKSRKERCRILLALLPTRGPTAYGSFQQALKQNSYPHLEEVLSSVAMTDMYTQHVSLTNHVSLHVNAVDVCNNCRSIFPTRFADPNLSNALQRNCCILRGNLEPDDLLDLHYQEFILCRDQCDRIRSEKTRKERCTALLDELSKCRNDNVLSVFKMSLRKKYGYIVERIESEITETVPKELDTTSVPSLHGKLNHNTTCKHIESFTADVDPQDVTSSWHTLDTQLKELQLSSDDVGVSLKMTLATNLSSFEEPPSSGYSAVSATVRGLSEPSVATMFPPTLCGSLGSSSMGGFVSVNTVPEIDIYTATLHNDAIVNAVNPPPPCEKDTKIYVVTKMAEFIPNRRNIVEPRTRSFSKHTCTTEDHATHDTDDILAFTHADSSSSLLWQKHSQPPMTKPTSGKQHNRHNSTDSEDETISTQIIHRKRKPNVKKENCDKCIITSQGHSDTDNSFVTLNPGSLKPNALPSKRLETAFNFLSSLINQGQFDRFDLFSTHLRSKYGNNADMMCILGYLHASRDLFKTDFDSAKKHIDSAMELVPKTSNPKYFTLELFTALTRMFITQKKLQKLQSALDDAKMIIETDPVGCTGRAAGWLYMNDARNMTAIIAMLNVYKRNYVSAYRHLHDKAKRSFQLALVNFQRDGGKDGPFGFGYALCRLTILLLQCGDNGLTMDVLHPDSEDIDLAGGYLRQLEDSDIPIPRILEVHYLLARCDYQYRRGHTVRALEHAEAAHRLATEISMLEFTEHAHNRVIFLRTKAPLVIENVDEDEAARVLFEDSE